MDRIPEKLCVRRFPLAALPVVALMLAGVLLIWPSGRSGSTSEAPTILGPDETSARVTKSASLPVPDPVGLSIPALGVNVPLRPVSREPGGAMGAPASAYEAGWDAPGPPPGGQGNALVAAHRDLNGNLGPFWRLAELRPGDGIVVRLADGRTVSYVVEWGRSYAAKGAPLDQIFGSSREAVLTLITCGGAFDRNSREYLDRVVVRARFVPYNVAADLR